MLRPWRVPEKKTKIKNKKRIAINFKVAIKLPF